MSSAKQGHGATSSAKQGGSVTSSVELGHTATTSSVEQEGEVKSEAELAGAVTSSVEEEDHGEAVSRNGVLCGDKMSSDGQKRYRIELILWHMQQKLEALKNWNLNTNQWCYSG